MDNAYNRTDIGHALSRPTPASPVPFTMTSVAFPKSIFSELAADLLWHACRTGESIMLSSKGSIRHLLKVAALIAFCCSFAHAQGACPASAPVTGNHCYFIAANGADTNNGTSQSTPWLHAPGMPNCSGTCATVQSSFGGAGTKNAGVGLIFRGGDTWHFGNASLNPYTGGTWTPQWDGDQSTCVYEGTQTGCFYVGVDTSWYTGGSWKRPILTGDNPTSTTTVSSCAYHTGSRNYLVQLDASPYQYWDSFEMTGLCGDTPYSDSAYITNNGIDQPPNTPMMTFYVNLYMHGWTVSTATAQGSSLVCEVFHGGSLGTWDHVVVDGADSNPGTCAWGTFPDIHHMRDSIFRYTTQGVANWCHDIHDNIWEYLYNPYVPTHGNALECNSDATGNAKGQPQNTPNVYYNNIMRHFDPSMGKNGQVDLWFCPTQMPEYWFNNLMYDLNPAANGGSWDIAGPAGYGCNNSGGQFMFNNTLVDTIQPCHLNDINNGTGGKYLTVLNEHLINAPYDGTGCTGGASSGTNISMSDATATSQGYTTGSPGYSSPNNCANDSTAPCGPTSANNSTVGVGGTHQTYCTTLASYSSEPAIGTDAANACQYGTTDGCAYNSTSHTMVCPAQAAVARLTKWDAGGYQYNTQDPPPNPPTGLSAVVN